MPDTVTSATSAFVTPSASAAPAAADTPPVAGVVTSLSKAKASSRMVYRTLDAWRGLAALAVVLLHSYAFQSERFPAFAHSAVFQPIQYGYLGVELFFVISGYCIAAAALSHINRGEPVQKFIWARLRRIFPPYWASTLLFVGSAFCMLILVHLHKTSSSQIVNILDTSRHGPRYFIANATLTQAWFGQELINPVAWTLVYELSFYAIFALVIAALARRGADSVLLALHGLTAGVLLWQIIAPQICPFPLDMWPHFGVGVLLFDYLRRRQAREVRAMIAVIFALLVTFIVVRDVPLGTMSHSSRIAGSVVLVFTLLLAALHPQDERLARNPLIRALGVVGVFSYSLYLISFLSLALLRQGISRLPSSEILAAPGMLLLVLATVGIGYGFHLLFEKPFLNMHRKPLGNAGGQASTASSSQASRS